jgi:ABC-type Fe3+ transport system permease subunit
MLLLGLAAFAEAQEPQAQEAALHNAHSPAVDLDSAVQALVSLPIAAGLGAILAFRPRRHGAPKRSPEVVQTQIVLALVGAVVMIVIGASLARAFGIAGAASLVRYRSKINDPKDASVMLSALSIGLASGVGLYLLAACATIFILAVLSGLEWLEPRPTKVFTLKIQSKDPARLQPAIEALFKRNRIKHDLRSTTNSEVCYEVQLPLAKKTDRLSEAIRDLDKTAPPAVEWQEKKASKG